MGVVSAKGLKNLNEQIFFSLYYITFTLYWFFHLREKGKATKNENINDSFIT